MFLKTNFKRWRSIAIFGHFAEAIARQSGFGNWSVNLDEWSARMLMKLEPVSRKSRRLFGPEKPFILRPILWTPTYSVKLVFSYVVKGIKIKITAKFRASRCLCFEDTKRIMSLEMRPKSFGAFQKRAPRTTWPWKARARVLLRTSGTSSSDHVNSDENAANLIGRMNKNNRAARAVE